MLKPIPYTKTQIGGTPVFILKGAAGGAEFNSRRRGLMNVLGCRV